VGARALAVLLVIVACGAAAWVTLDVYTQHQELSVGQVVINTEPGNGGSLDFYVPLVDWGVRFNAVRFPARLRVDLRTVDRDVLTRVARGAALDVEEVRREARDAIASYLLWLILFVGVASLGFGSLVALAVRGGSRPRLRWTIGTAGGASAAIVLALLLTLPPRGAIDEPEYFAFGPDIPRALEAVETVRQATRTLDTELEAQLVGLARLVIEPADRPALKGRPLLTLASDLHNNFIAVPVLESAAAGAPLFFAGDLTDRGTRAETQLVRRVVQAGKPFVFVSGNHDSDALIRELRDDGAIVLTRARGIVRVGSLRVAGYEDPFERRSADDFEDRFADKPTPEMQQEFADWLRPKLGLVDIVMVHEPELAALAIEEMRASSPVKPLVMLVGHTHRAGLERIGPVTILNGGSVGAGGSGNLAEDTDLGLARLVYDVRPFHPLAADLVEIDPGTGSATARRERLG
jgi:predicted phosphodiesterase